MRLGPFCFLAFFLSVCLLPVAAQPAATEHGNPAADTSLAIDKIDPPNWWTNLPSPMLLVHGHGLRDARFSVVGQGVALTRSSVSENGHWAFLWIETENAAPQTLEIFARRSGTEVHAAFSLARREQRPQAHTGLQNSDVLYLIMPDRFADAAPNPAGDDRSAPHGWHGGDLAGIEQHLDNLRALGVTALWTTPVLSNGTTPDSYHGYAATDLYAIDAHLGSLSDYRRLSAALHARGMKLLMDLVPNHISILHPWVDDPPAPNWLHGTRAQHLAVQYDLRKLVDPHTPAQARLPITDGWFTDAMPDLNQDNPLLRHYLIQNALWWVESADLDGFRLDTFQYVGRDFWRDFHAELHHIYPHLTTLGEILDPDAEIVSYFAGGFPRNGIDTGLDTPFDYPLHFALRAALTDGKPMTELERVLRQDELYPHPERLVAFLDNHDTLRFFTALHGSLPEYKLALGLLLTLRGTPLLYAGDEIALTGGNDPDNRHDYPGGFPHDAHNAFLTSGRTTAEQEVYAWTRDLLALRASHIELQSGREEHLLATDDVFVYARSRDDSPCKPDHMQPRLLVVANKSAVEQIVSFDTGQSVLSGCTRTRTLTPTRELVPVIDAGKWTLSLPPESFSLLAVQ